MKLRCCQKTELDIANDTSDTGTSTPDNRSTTFWCQLQIEYDLLKSVASGIAITESNSSIISSVPDIKEKLQQRASCLSQQEAKK
ncbi:hypothetical protein QE152_g7351 [Popillia japonica]|uniref:Uncharacterized protein n=1 Tax=Popillia japonica TaxID=7064 RepID=A0AAW1MAW0_POPJA